MKRLWIGLTACGVAWFLSGCATTDKAYIEPESYEQPDLNAGPFAHLRSYTAYETMFNGSDKFLVAYIDGKSSAGFTPGPKGYRITPGHHKIGVLELIDTEGAFQSVADLEIAFDAAADTLYTVKGDRKKGWSRAWIENVETGARASEVSKEGWHPLIKHGPGIALVESIFATDRYQIPKDEVHSAARIFNSSMKHEQFYLWAIDGKYIDSMSATSGSEPTLLTPGEHDLLVEGDYFDGMWGKRNCPCRGFFTFTVTLKAATDYRIRGQMGSDGEFMQSWIEEAPGGERVTPKIKKMWKIRLQRGEYGASPTTEE
ncbi:MAG: hypothetical protein H7831_03625 [Magnetococcus sp. WYHC-3]